MGKSDYLIAFCLLVCLRCTGPSTNISTPEATLPTPQPDTGTVNLADTLRIEKESAVIPIDYDTTEWTELTRLDSSIPLDLKYAASDNFVNEKMYACARCFLRPEVARAVILAHQQLQEQGYGLKMLDCYRPHSIQWILWKKMPDPRYVTDPQKGSMHNRGAAVDLTLIDSLGRELDMGAPFDYFGPAAYHTATDLPDTILIRRRLLKSIMEAQGFRAIRTEWWHYSFQERFYPVSDMLWKCYE